MASHGTYVKDWNPKNPQKSKVCSITLPHVLSDSMFSLTLYKYRGLL